MKISFQQFDDVSLATLNGGLNAVHVDTIRRELGQWVDGQESTLNFVLDLQDVQMMDSSGLGALVGLRKRIHERKGSLHLVGVDRKVRMVFHVTRTQQFFSFHNTLEEALDACRT